LKNRLQLNWELPTAKERIEFLSQYIEGLPFEPSPAELDTCAAYVLWGFDEDGKNGEQKGQYDLGRKRKSWTQKEPASLDELVSTAGESEILPKSYVPTKVTREVFSREKTRREAPPDLLILFEALWSEIDILDLALCEYEQKLGKRKTPPRAELLARLTPAQIETAHQKSHLLTSFSYLKERHHLIELRRQQYTLRDSFSIPTPRALLHTPAEDETLSITPELGIAPVGFSQQFFVPFNELTPKNFGEKDLRALSKVLWKKTDPDATFDFRKEQNLLEFLELREDFRNTPLQQIFTYYAREANLSESQNDLLARKLRGETNAHIAQALNETYGSHYTDNYISTIYRQKIIPQIATAARVHRELLENLFFPENWKVCTGCGRLLLRSNDFFVKKSRASDGLTGRCKRCDKEERARKSKRKKEEEH
jgi:hypothetical protein